MNLQEMSKDEKIDVLIDWIKNLAEPVLDDLIKEFLEVE